MANLHTYYDRLDDARKVRLLQRLQKLVDKLRDLPPITDPPTPDQQMHQQLVVIGCADDLEQAGLLNDESAHELVGTINERIQRERKVHTAARERHR